MEPEKAQGHYTLGQALRQYFNDDFSAPERVHPFMSEVAHLACHRGIRQESLAKCYNDATGKRIGSRNVKQHLTTKRLSGKVIAGYSKALKMSETYVGLLMALDSGKPYFTPKPGSFGEYALLDHLRPEDARPQYKDGAVDEVVRLLENDKALTIRCLDAAELAWCRHQAFDKQPAQDESAVKWRIVGEILQAECAFDLAGKATTKSPQRLAAERMLLEVFELLRRLDLGEHGPKMLEWYEWEAIRAQLESNFYRRGLPVENMRKRLHDDFFFQEWADVHDPQRFT